MSVGKNGSIPMPSPPDGQQPSSSQGPDSANAQVGETILRWKAKWGPSGTARGVGYLVAPQDISDGRHLRGVPQEASVAAGAEPMEIGNVKKESVRDLSG